jgi:Na+/melibiose symporter-like transporter
MNFAFNLFFHQALLGLFRRHHQPDPDYGGLSAGLGNQTPASVHGITLLQSLVPAMFHLCWPCLLKCRLNGPMMKRISTDLHQRHSHIS